MLNSLKLLKQDPSADDEGVEEEEEDEVEVEEQEDEGAPLQQRERPAAVESDVDMEPAAEPLSEKAQGKQVKLETEPDGQPVINVPLEVKTVRKQLVDLEKSIPDGHVTWTGPQIIKWRGVVNKAATFAEVAQHLLALREGMLDVYKSAPLFKAGWEMEGAKHKQWSRAALAPGQSLETLQDRMRDLWAAYTPNAPPIPQPVSPHPVSPQRAATATGGASTSSDPATAVEPRQKRGRCDEEGSSSSSGAPTLKAKVRRIAAELELDDQLPIAKVVKLASAELDLVPEAGMGLPSQVDAILKLITDE